MSDETKLPNRPGATGSISEILFIQAAANVMPYRYLNTEMLRAFCAEIGVEILDKPRPTVHPNAVRPGLLDELENVAIQLENYDEGDGVNNDCAATVREASALLSHGTIQANAAKPKITEQQALRLIQEYNAGYAIVDALVRAGFEWPDV